MSQAIRRLAAALVILVVAAQAIFAVAACPNLAAPAGFDPASSICHGGDAGGSSTPQPAGQPACCLLACILCHATAAAPPQGPAFESVAPVAAGRVAAAADPDAPAPARVLTQFARGPPFPV